MTYEEAEQLKNANEYLINTEYRNIPISAIQIIPAPVTLDDCIVLSNLLKEGLGYGLDKTLPDYEVLIFFDLPNWSMPQPLPMMYLTALLRYMDSRKKYPHREP